MAVSMWNPLTLVAATDGREQSDGAIRAGAWLAETGASWRIVSVAPPLPIVTPDIDLQIRADAIDVSLGNQRRLLQEQLARVLVHEPSAEIDVRYGDPADEVCRAAEEANASLIVAGLGRRRLIDRLLADETALRIIRSASMPVFAVPPDFTPAASAAIVGVDFSETSVHAARLAVGLVRDVSTIYLVNVAPREDVLSLATGGREAYEAYAMPKLKQVAQDLHLPERVHLQPVIRHGDPAAALLKYASETRSELIAIGTRGLGLVSRLLLGSVATKVIRASSIAVLTVPA
jgi:nucleotide-binding universal stress UspA family protein